MAAKRKKPQRRAPGSGTWFRRKDGRVVIRLTVLNNLEQTERVELTLPKSTTDADAQAQLDAYLVARGAGRLRVSDAYPVGEYLETWMANHLQRKRTNTRATYETLVRKHVLPAIGRLDLAVLHQRHLNALWTEMDAAGLSRTTIAMVRGILRQVLHAARSEDLVDANAAELSRLPDAMEDETIERDIDPQSVRLLLDDLADHPYILAFHLAAYRGLRVGEITGLCRSAVDLERGILEVRQTLVNQRHGGWVINGPKTKKSRRTLPLSPRLVALFRARMAQQNAERLRGGAAWLALRDTGLVLEGRRVSGDLLFTQPSGRLVRADVLNYALSTACERCGVPRITMHWLRHAANSVLQAEGVPIETRMAILGHTSEAMNYHYTHVQRGAMEDALDHIDRRLGS